MMSIAPGTVINGRYTIDGYIGRGGMAAVYLARHNQLGTAHAIKVLSLPTPAVRERLLQEGRVQGRMRHPNIVLVTDVVDVDGSPGLVMEYVEGPSLHQFLKLCRPSPAQTAALARGILGGVGHAHKNGLIHRDLKPANVLLEVHEDALVPKITDFGLAKVLLPDVAPDGMATRSGVPMGTPAYMAPEQIADASRVDARADVFALGAILYELTTGRRAFDGADMVDVFSRIKEGNYLPPRQVWPDLPEPWEQAIVQALASDVEQRAADCETLLTLIDSVPLPEHPWTPEILSQAGEIASSHTSSHSLTQPSMLERSTHETFATFAEPSTAETTKPAPAPSRWPLAALLVGGTLAAALAVAVMQPVETPVPEAPTVEVLTAARVPVVLDDDVQQTQLQSAWRALLDADLRRAERQIGVVVAQEPDDPLPWLVQYCIKRSRGELGSDKDAFWQAVERSREREGRPAALARAGEKVRRSSWEVAGDELLALVEAEPTDWLGPLVAASLAPPEVRLAMYDRLHALDPSRALPPWSKARQLIYMEQWDEAQQAIEAGLAQNPGHPGLSTALGEATLNLGQFAEARDILTRALAQDPGDDLALRRLAAAKVMLGEPPPHAAAEMLTPARQVNYARDLSQVYAGIGAIDQAVDVLEAAQARAIDDGDLTTAVVLGGDLGNLFVLSRRYDRILAVVQGNLELMTRPEFPDGERDTISRNLLFAQGVAHARVGEVEAARKVRARLARVDGVWPIYTEWLEHELAAAEGRAEDAAKAFVHMPQGCGQDLYRGRFALDAGSVEVAAPHYRQAIERGDCKKIGEMRFLLAEAHAVLAEVDPGSRRLHELAVATLLISRDPGLKLGP